MSRAIRVLAVMTLLFVAARAALADEPPADLASRRAAFEAKFTDRSPMSAMPELAKRLNIKPAPDAEYDLSKESFWVYVPQDYDAAQKYGLVIYLNYKATTSTPQTLHEMFDQKHLIFASPANSVGRPDATQAGLALDAVHNLSKAFNVDPARVYLIGATDASGKLAFNAGDVFIGDALIFQGLVYWKDLKTKVNTFYRARMAHPQGQVFGVTTKRPFVCGDDGGEESLAQLLQRALVAEGFKSATFMTTTKDDVHYPNFVPEWFTKVLAAWDEAAKDETVTTVATPAASAARGGAATEPAPAAPAPPAPAAAAPSEPQRLLKLATSYISANRYPQARERLETIVDKYPADPAATEAKQLLEQINGK